MSAPTPGKVIEMNAQMQSEQWGQVEQVVAAACRLAASGEARAVHVVTGRRPSYADLVRYRSYAESRDLAMTVLGTGDVVLRTRRAGPVLATNRKAGDRGPRWHGPAWISELCALNEGTR